MKRYLKIIGLLTIGSAIGIVGTLYWTESTLKGFKKMSALLTVAGGLEEADYLYKNAPPEITIYKLNRVLSQIEMYEEIGIDMSIHNDNERINWDKGLIHGRIGKLYKKLGNENKASDHANKAINFFSTFGWELKDANELFKAIDMLDTNKITEVIQSIGKFKKENYISKKTLEGDAK